ncbi:unnamed protein product [Rhizoctonia solani]|uniref:Endo-1,5-alpha-L-arabinanase A n=1 Tax=Rhizoctonia solani TaxID=456999 RepID=A0A8H2ZYZ0_9AGAM|nr:unnamed protein product [Rhizoctonia solani]
MWFTFSGITLSVLSLVSGVLAVYPNPGKVTGSIDVHDPSICRDSSGKYFLFSTAPGIAIRTSTDRTNWSYAGTVWSSGQATWTDKYTNSTNGSGNIWAPDCTYKNGQFYLYYSASSFGSRNSAVFFATSTTGLPGSWTNQGLVLSTTDSSDYNMVTTGGSPSVRSGLVLSSGGGAVEAPMLIKNGNYYYLFTSWDKCCDGTSSTYNIRVGRSTSITGPYVDKSGVALTSGGGTEILGSHGSIIGPGGQSVFKDTDGWVIDYHYYTRTGSLLGLNLLDFSSGWPVVS